MSVLGVLLVNAESYRSKIPRAVLRVENLSKSFHSDLGVAEKYLFRDVNFVLEPGSITALTGGNGTGKTSLLNIINGFEHPTSGIISLEGQDITSKAPEYRARMGMGRMFQENHIFPNISILENLLIASSDFRAESPWRIFQGAKNRDRFEVQRSKALNILQSIFKESIVRTAESRLANDLSFGQKRRLELARLLMREYSLILLDEPTAGIDKEEVSILIDQIKSLNSTSKSAILFIEHDENVVKELAHQILELAEQKISSKEFDGLAGPCQIEVKRKISQGMLITEAPLQSSLLIENLSARYPEGADDEWVLEELSVDILKGEKVLLLGKNGSGKSTLTKSLFNIDVLLNKESTIKHDSLEITQAPPWVISDSGMGYLMQGGRVFRSLSIAENLSMAMLHVIDQVGLYKKYRSLLNKPNEFRADKLSTGERHLLALMMVLMKNPRFLIMDEPIAGIDISSKNIIFNILKTLEQDRDLTLIIIEHNSAAVSPYCSRVIELDRRKIIRDEKINN